MLIDMYTPCRFGHVKQDVSWTVMELACHPEYLQVFIRLWYQLSPSTRARLGYSIAGRGGIEVVEFLHISGHFAEHLCNGAAWLGQYDCLRFYFERGYSWDADEIIMRAANSNSLSCLRFAHIYGRGALDVKLLDWVHGIDQLRYVLDRIATPFDEPDLCATCVEWCEDDVLEMLHEEYGFKLTPRTMTVALRTKNLSCVQFLRAHGVSCD